MKHMIKSLRVLLAIYLFPLIAHAELILLKKNNNDYHLVTPKSTSQDIETAKNIFQNILLKYQWPMVTVNFDEFSPEEQRLYLKALKKDYGIVGFIQDKIDKVYGGGVYKVVDIPTSIFEIAVMNGFSDFIIKAQKPAATPQGTPTLFKGTDIRNGDFAINKFNPQLTADLYEALKKYAGQPNAAQKAMKEAFDKYNLNPGTEELYFQTLGFLETNLSREDLSHFETHDINKEFVEKIVTKLIKEYDQKSAAFEQNLREKENILYGKMYISKVYPSQLKSWEFRERIFRGIFFLKSTPLALL